MINSGGGYSEEQCKVAIITANGDINFAFELLLCFVFIFGASSGHEGLFWEQLWPPMTICGAFDAQLTFQ